MDIRAEQVAVRLGGRTIIENIDMEVSNRQFVGIVGPNGSGKSTFLKTIYRALKPSGGSVWLDGRPMDQVSLRESARMLGVMTQMSTLNFDFRVEEVVLMGRTPHKKLMEQDGAEDYRLAHEALEKTGMAEYADRKFNTLSGGERQRVLMARALTQQPRAMILDEPTNHLDIQYQLQLLQTVRALDIEIFAAMHDLNLALAYCDKIYVMSQGHIVASGPPVQVLTAALIRQVFHVEALITDMPQLGRKNSVFLSA